MLVLHATEAMGGGVQSAITAYVAALPAHTHVVLGRPRVGENTSNLREIAEVRTAEKSLPSFLLWVRRQVEELNPDVVHLHSSLAGLARAILPRGMPIVYSPHCFAFERLDQNRFSRAAYRTVEQLLSRRTAISIAVSPHELELAHSLSRHANARYVPNVVKSERAFHGPSGTRTVVMIGRAGAQKGADVFARVAQIMGPDYRFVWIGDGLEDDRQMLESSGVEMTGWLDQIQIRKVLEISDLYVHTGAWEAAPIAPLEAAAQGVPVLSKDIETMRSLGYEVAGPAPEGIALAVRRYFDDPVFTALVLDASRTVISRFDETDVSRRLEDVYYEAQGSPTTVTWRKDA